MRPFEVHTTLEGITSAYPTAQAIAVASRIGGSKARLALVRLWLSEGIPYAFRDRPAVYEELRFWMASRFGVDAKEISIVGSARIGQSLSLYNVPSFLLKNYFLVIANYEFMVLMQRFK